MVQVSALWVGSLGEQVNVSTVTTYEVIGELPALSGARHERVALAVPPERLDQRMWTLRAGPGAPTSCATVLSLAALTRWALAA